MQQQDVMKIFEKTNAILKGHFLLSSGLHSDTYMQCALVLQYPEYAHLLCGMLADKFRNLKPETVVGPALGGVIVSYETGRCLGIRSLFTERENSQMVFRRGFSIKKGERVLAVEDVITTGGSIKETVELCSQLGAEVIGVGAIVDRSAQPPDFGGIPVKTLIKIDVNTYPAQECPLCKTDNVLVKPGSRTIK